MQFRRTPFYSERCLPAAAGRGRKRGRHPWSVASLARPKGVATRGVLPHLPGRKGSPRGALPRLRGRKGSPPVERCLACQTDRSEPVAYIITPDKSVLYTSKKTDMMSVMYRESRKHPARQLTVSVGNLSTILHVTACTFQRRRILACEETHNLILDAWTQAPEWTVGRYVIMPDHVHLFCRRK